MKIKIFNVGHGSCAVVSAGNVVFIMDCGSTHFPPSNGKLSKLQTRTLVDYVHQQQVDHVNFVISHADKDHTSMLMGLYKVLRQEYNVKLVGGGSRADYNFDFSDDVAAFSDEANFFSHLTEPPTCTFEILSVLREEQVRSANKKNALSIVAKFTEGKYSIIFPGDANLRSLSEIHSKNTDSLKCTVYVLSHHGSSSDFTNNIFLLAATEAKLFVASVGEKTYIEASLVRDICTLPSTMNLKQAHEITVRDDIFCSNFFGQEFTSSQTEKTIFLTKGIVTTRGSGDVNIIFENDDFIVGLDSKSYYLYKEKL